MLLRPWPNVLHITYINFVQIFHPKLLILWSSSLTELLSFPLILLQAFWLERGYLLNSIHYYNSSTASPLASHNNTSFTISSRQSDCTASTCCKTSKQSKCPKLKGTRNKNTTMNNFPKHYQIIFMHFNPMEFQFSYNSLQAFLKIQGFGVTSKHVSALYWNIHNICKFFIQNQQHKSFDIYHTEQRYVFINYAVSGKEQNLENSVYFRLISFKLARFTSLYIQHFKL